MAGPRVEYREAGAAIREAVGRLPADATGMEAKVLLALVALVSSWSRRSDDVHLEAIAELVYGTPGEPFTATRTQTSRLGKVLRRLADEGVIELDRPGQGRPPADRRAYYRVTFPAEAPQDRENAAPQDRDTQKNAAPPDRGRGPTGPRNAAPQGPPYEKNEKNYEEGPALTLADLLTPHARRDPSLVEEAEGLEIWLLDAYGESIAREAITTAHRRNLTAAWPSQLRTGITTIADRLVQDHRARRERTHAERIARRASCTTCDGAGVLFDDHDAVAGPCPSCATEAVA